MKEFTNSEKCDMLEVYFSSDKNSTLAEKRYTNKYRDRKCPSSGYFGILYENVRDYGAFMPVIPLESKPVTFTASTSVAAPDLASEPAPVPKSEYESESAPNESKCELVPKTESKSEPVPKSKCKSEPISKPESKSEPASKPKSKSEPASNPKSKSEPASNPKSKSEPASNPKSKSAPVPKPAAATKPQTSNQSNSQRSSYPANQNEDYYDRLIKNILSSNKRSHFWLREEDILEMEARCPSLRMQRRAKPRRRPRRPANRAFNAAPQPAHRNVTTPARNSTTSTRNVTTPAKKKTTVAEPSAKKIKLEIDPADRLADQPKSEAELSAKPLQGIKIKVEPIDFDVESPSLNEVKLEKDATTQLNVKIKEEFPIAVKMEPIPESRSSRLPRAAKEKNISYF